MPLLSMFTRPAPEDVTGEVYWGKAPDEPGLPLVNGKIKGWAYDTHRGARLTVQLRIDGVAVARARRGIRRRVSNNSQEAQSGFIIDVPERARGNGCHHFRICIAGTDILLPNGAFFASLNDEGELIKLDHAEGGPAHRLLLPWHRPTYEGGGLADVKRLVSVGRADEACELLRDLYNAKPSSKQLLERLSRVSMTAGRYDEALAALECVLTRDRSDESALERRVRVFIKLGRIEELPQCLDALYQATAGGGGAPLGRLAKAYAHDGCYDIALLVLDFLLEREPRSAAALEQRVGVLVALGEIDALPDALHALAEVWQDTPQLIDGWIQYYTAKENWPMALDWLVRKRRAIHDHPKHAIAVLTEIIQVCDHLSDLEAAARHAAEAVEAFPSNAVFRQIEGDRLLALGRLDDAAARYEAALEIDRKHVVSHVRLGEVYFLLGRFGDAFDQLEWRFSKLDPAKDDHAAASAARWRGDIDLPGALLVWAEDDVEPAQTLSQLSLVPVLTDQLGLSVVLVVPPFMEPLARLSFPTVQVATRKDAALSGAHCEPITHHIALGSLSRFFRRSSGDFARFSSCFAVDQEQIQRIRAELSPNHSVRLIGLSAADLNGASEGPSLVELVRALNAPDIRFVVLGAEVEAADLALAQESAAHTIVVGVTVVGDGIVGFTNLVGAMDAVVASVGLAASLAGDLAVPSLVLTPPAPHAWWLGASGDCPWYPHTTVARQSTADAGWDTVLAQARRWLVSSAAKRPVQTAPSPSARPDQTETNLDHLLHIALTEQRGVMAAPIVAKLLEWRPEDTDLLMIQGETALSINDPKTAQCAFRALLARDPDLRRARVGLIHALVAQYELDEAAHHLKMVIHEAEPNLRRLYAILLLETGHADAALRHCEECLEAHDLSADEHQELVILLARALCSLGQHREALMRLEPLTTGYDVAPSAGLEKARILEDMDDFDGAIAAYAQTARSGADPAAATFFALCRKDPAYIGEPGTAKPVMIPPFQGDFPVVEQDDLVLYVSCDAVYWQHHTKTLLASVAHNSPGLFVHVHIINPDQACYGDLARFGQLFGARRLSATFETVDLSDVPDGYPAVYYSSIRFARLYQIATRKPAHYFCVDADCVVRAPLGALQRQVGLSDIALLRRFGRSLHLTVAAGGLFVRPTAAARIFLRDVAAGILSVLATGEAYWFLDQVVITSALERGCRSTTLAVSQLDYEYIDWCFRRDGIIWTGKGDRSEVNADYLQEKLLYARKADHAGRVQS